MLSLSNPDQFEAAFRNMRGVGALIQIDDAMFTSHRQQLVELANRYHIPGSYGLRNSWTSAASWPWDRATRTCIDALDRTSTRFSKGAKPADLPVEQANKFEMIINLETANALGLEIPPTLLARADEVIE